MNSATKIGIVIVVVLVIVWILLRYNRASQVYVAKKLMLYAYKLFGTDAKIKASKNTATGELLSMQLTYGTMPATPLPANVQQITASGAIIDDFFV